MVVPITQEERFIELVGAEDTGYVLVDFFAEWCGPCKRFSPTLDRLSTEWTDVKFYKVDVEVLENVAKEENISCMPTFVLFHNGSEVGRVSGATESKLVELLNKSL